MTQALFVKSISRDLCGLSMNDPGIKGQDGKGVFIHRPAGLNHSFVRQNNYCESARPHYFPSCQVGLQSG